MHSGALPGPLDGTRASSTIVGLFFCCSMLGLGFRFGCGLFNSDPLLFKEGLGVVIETKNASGDALRSRRRRRIGGDVRG